MQRKQPGKAGQRWLLLAIVALIVVTDQLSKLWIRSNLLPGESRPVAGLLQWTYVSNTGSAFGLFTNQTFLLSIVGLVSLLLILFFYRYFSPVNTLALVAITLVFGGAASNLIDRFHLGYVTDFIDVRLWHDFHWPSFNVADSAITIGAFMLAYFFWRLLKKEDGHAAKSGS